MFTEDASLYDLLYSNKDYKREAGVIANILSEKRPNCKSILDVACGTAEHHRYLKEAYATDGIDLNRAFLEAARIKNPDGNYVRADMVDFKLARRYDVILCLFSSIGYVKTFDHLVAALRCFHDHLHAGGLVLVEPWLNPDTWYEGKLHMLTYDRDDIKICRMNRSETDGKLSIVHFHFLLGTREEGVKHFEERHELGLFSREEMEGAFRTAGLEVSFDEEGLTGRGLYLGGKQATL